MHRAAGVNARPVLAAKENEALFFRPCPGLCSCAAAAAFIRLGDWVRALPVCGEAWPTRVELREVRRALGEA